MGNTEGGMQAQSSKSRQANKTTLTQAVQMFRDQIGLVLNVTERLMFSLGVLTDPSEFQFHAYSPEKLVECNSSDATYKLFLVYKYLASFRVDMDAEFPDQIEEIQMQLQGLDNTFRIAAGQYEDKVESLKVNHPKEHYLIVQVLNRIFKGTYTKLDPEFSARLRKEIRSTPGTETFNGRNHTSAMAYMHRTNQMLDETLDYMKRNPHEKPNSAFDPVTRVSSTSLDTNINFIGGNPRRAPNNYVPTVPPHMIQEEIAQNLLWNGCSTGAGSGSQDQNAQAAMHQKSAAHGGDPAPTATCACGTSRNQTCGAPPAGSSGHQSEHSQTGGSSKTFEDHESAAIVAEEESTGQVQIPQMPIQAAPAARLLNGHDTKATLSN